MSLKKTPAEVLMGMIGEINAYRGGAIDVAAKAVEGAAVGFQRLGLISLDDVLYWTGQARQVAELKKHRLNQLAREDLL